ncbi:MAG: hypothetical protein IT317_23305 [Anaerolineales bacterium]|nr:hypothetical protein [Anaerolineales bacterium]
MTGAFVVGVMALVLLLAWALAPRGVPWANNLNRVNAGAGTRAEWMAPDTVGRAIMRDFLATQEWLAGAARDWGRLARELDQYASGVYRQRQQNALGRLVQMRGPRLASVQTAQHTLAVRHFSADGLRCLVVDYQRERALQTQQYWSGALVHTQRLPDAVLVWQMAYDVHDRRWKVDRLVQRLPRPAPQSEGKLRLRLTDKLPAHAGRDA